MRTTTSRSCSTPSDGGAAELLEHGAALEEAALRVGYADPKRAHARAAALAITLSVSRARRASLRAPR